jgi:hypothetical protein
VFVILSLLPSKFSQKSRGFSADVSFRRGFPPAGPMGHMGMGPMGMPGMGMPGMGMGMPVSTFSDSIS